MTLATLNTHQLLETAIDRKLNSLTYSFIILYR